MVYKALYQAKATVWHRTGECRKRNVSTKPSGRIQPLHMGHIGVTRALAA